MPEPDTPRVRKGRPELWTRNVMVVRCLRLARQLEHARVRPDLELLAREHGVSVRTIRRDLNALNEAGYKIPIGFNPL